MESKVTDSSIENTLGLGGFSLASKQDCELIYQPCLLHKALESPQ
jgi:hypothetical protein